MNDTRLMSRLTLTLLLVMLLALPLAGHLAATRSIPADGSTVRSVDRIQVWFTQEPELAVSALELEGARGAVRLGAIEVGEEHSLTAAVPSALAPGAYTVTWRTAGDDGHVLRGEYGFTVE